MKIIPSMEETFKNDILFMGVSDWRDFSTKEIKGVEIHCVEGEFFESFDVRIKGAKRDMFKDIERHQQVTFIDFKINTWNFNGKKGLTISASSMHILD